MFEVTLNKHVHETIRGKEILVAGPFTSKSYPTLMRKISQTGGAVFTITPPNFY